jgi:hypothetical protein
MIPVKPLVSVTPGLMGQWKKGAETDRGGGGGSLLQASAEEVG